MLYANYYSDWYAHGIFLSALLWSVSVPWWLRHLHYHCPAYWCFMQLTLHNSVLSRQQEAGSYCCPRTPWQAIQFSGERTETRKTPRASLSRCLSRIICTAEPVEKYMKACSVCLQHRQKLFLLLLFPEKILTLQMSEWLIVMKRLMHVYARRNQIILFSVYVNSEVGISNHFTFWSDWRNFAHVNLAYVCVSVCLPLAKQMSKNILCHMSINATEGAIGPNQQGTGQRSRHLGLLPYLVISWATVFLVGLAQPPLMSEGVQELWQKCFCTGVKFWPSRQTAGQRVWPKRLFVIWSNDARHYWHVTDINRYWWILASTPIQ